MLLWTAPDPAPNPRRVHLFLDAKGLKIPTTELSLFKREHKADAVLAMNPRGQVPFLELNDGTVIAESVAICRYLDELYPEPPLFGTTPLERAETDMWIRRIETALGVPVGLAWQHGHALTAKLVAQIPAMGNAAKSRALESMMWIDGQLAGHDWLASNRVTMSDIILLTTIDFAAWIGIGVADTLPNLKAWHARATQRFVR